MKTRLLLSTLVCLAFLFPLSVPALADMEIKFSDPDYPLRLSWWGGGTSYNIYRGDLEALRSSGSYTQDPALHPLASQTCDRIQSAIDDPFIPPVGSGVFYLVTEVNDGEEDSLGFDSAGQPRPNSFPCVPCPARRPYTTLIHGDWGADSIPGQLRVIYTREDWCSLFPSLCTSTYIDFATEVVAVASLGLGPSCRGPVAITCIQDGAIVSDIYLTVKELDMSGWYCAPDPWSQPVHVVKIPRPVGNYTSQTIFETPLE